MKKIVAITLLLSVFCIGFLNAQNIHPDEKLYAKYQEQDIQNLLEHNPEAVAILNFGLNAGYSLMNVGIEKLEGLEYLHYFDRETKSKGERVEALDYNIENIYVFDFERRQDRAKTYRVGDTGYILVFHSKTKLYNLYKAQD